MAWGLLLLLVTMSSGCLIPDPLTRRPQDTNFQPVFVPSEMAPKLGQLPPGISNAPLELRFAVDDQNLFDTLRVRLFIEKTVGTTMVVEQVTATDIILDKPQPEDPAHPGRRIGRSNSINYCNFVQDQSQPNDLIAVVADRLFGTGSDAGTNDMGPAGQDQSPGGLTDERIWTLRCTQ